MDLIATLLEEERALQAKLEAVRRMLAVYRGTGNEAAAPSPIRAKPLDPSSFLTEHRSHVLRIDKFGAYGNAIVEKSLTLLPDAKGAPVMTRDLIERLERSGMEVRGTNKVNALSAILARSSRLTAHGRRGWTRAKSEGSSAHKENEPTSGNAVGSDAADKGVQPPESASGNSSPIPSG
jgi:hypothetical protein